MEISEFDFKVWSFACKNSDILDIFWVLKDENFDIDLCFWSFNKAEMLKIFLILTKLIFFSIIQVFMLVRGNLNGLQQSISVLSFWVCYLCLCQIKLDLEMVAVFVKSWRCSKYLSSGDFLFWCWFNYAWTAYKTNYEHQIFLSVNRSLITSYKILIVSSR